MKSNFVRLKEVRQNTSKHKPSWISRFLLIICVLFLALSIDYLYNSQIYSRVQKKFTSLLSSTCATTGLTLQNVYLEGQNYTDTNLILSALPVKIGQPILAIPLEEVKTNLEKIGWIKNATVERRLPNSLFISITERAPVALWQNNRAVYLIDEDGTIITDRNLAEFSHFIILVGDDAPFRVNDLFGFLKKNVELFDQVASAIRIGERRWNIRLNNGLEIKLPESNPKKAWDYLIKLHTQKNLITSNIRVIDLRDSNKLYIK